MKGIKNFKKAAFVLAAIIVLGSAGAVYAATYKTPADIVAGLTGKTADQVADQRETGKTYGQIANDAGKLDEFKAQMLEQKKAILDQRVKDGTLTQAQADEIYNSIKERQAACDGTGLGMMNGRGLGAGSCGMGQGAGLGSGAGRGCGMGRGFGLRN